MDPAPVSSTKLSNYFMNYLHLGPAEKALLGAYISCRSSRRCACAHREPGSSADYKTGHCSSRPSPPPVRREREEDEKKRE